MTVSDYPDWQTPQAHATKIAATGVPLLRASNNLGNNTGTTITGNTSVTLLAAGAFTQPGYEIGVRVSMPAGTGTVPFVALTLTWSDTALGLPTARRDVVVTAGNAPANAVTSFFNGPARGNTLQVVAKNLDPSVTATVDWTINQTSHLYDHDQAGQQAYPGTAPNGFTNPMGVSGTGVIVWAHPVLGASSTAAFLCALYGGDVYLEVDAAGISAPVGISLTDAAGYAMGTSAGEVFGETVAAGATISVPLTLPYTPILLALTNTGTTPSVAPKASLIAQNH